MRITKILSTELCGHCNEFYRCEVLWADGTKMLVSWSNSRYLEQLFENRLRELLPEPVADKLMEELSDLIDAKYKEAQDDGYEAGCT